MVLPVLPVLLESALLVPQGRQGRPAPLDQGRALRGPPVRPEQPVRCPRSPAPRALPERQVLPARLGLHRLLLGLLVLSVLLEQREPPGLLALQDRLGLLER